MADYTSQILGTSNVSSININLYDLIGDLTFLFGFNKKIKQTF